MPHPPLTLPEVDRIEVTTLYDCLVDATAPDVGPGKRLKASSKDPIVADLLEGEQRRRLVGGRRPAVLVEQALREAGLEVAESIEPAYLLEQMILVTGQVARTNDYEIGYAAHWAERDGTWQPDPLICDDQGLVMNLRGQGLVVLSGCGHAGI